MQLTNSPPWLISLKHKSAEFISVALLCVSAFLLTTYTMQLQHSCEPLLDWTEIPASCLIVDRPNDSPPPEKLRDRSRKTEEVVVAPPSEENKKTLSKEDINDGKSESNDGTKFSKEVIGIAAGSAVVIGAAVVGAPIAIAAGAGFAVWFAFTTLFSMGS